MSENTHTLSGFPAAASVAVEPSAADSPPAAPAATIPEMNSLLFICSLSCPLRRSTEKDHQAPDAFDEKSAVVRNQ